MEVPIITTRAGGVAAFSAGQDDMLTVPVEDGPALAEGLRRLLRNAELRRGLATAARRRVEQECSFLARAQKMVSIYDGLV